MNFQNCQVGTFSRDPNRLQNINNFMIHFDFKSLNIQNLILYFDEYFCKFTEGYKDMRFSFY